MKAPAFDYVRPESLEAACALLREHGADAQVLAGGQSLLAALNLRLAAPALLVDIGGLPAMKQIELVGSGGQAAVRTGALVTHAQLLKSLLLADKVPLLAAAVPHVAHLAIRNAGTVGGSLALADPAAEYPAVALALNARLVLQGADGRRVIEAKDYFQGLYTTARADDELLVAIDWPVALAGQRFSFLELARRRGDYGMVGVAAALSLQGDTVEQARLAWFAVADRPVLSAQAATALVGRQLDDAAIAAACAALGNDFTAQASTDCSSATRMHLARVLLGRALRAIGEHA